MNSVPSKSPEQYRQEFLSRRAPVEPPRHRQPGSVGSLTVHAPADYRPRHVAEVSR